MSLKLNVSSHLNEEGAQILSTEISDLQNSILLPDFDSVDDSQVIPAYARNFDIGVYMKITFDPYRI